MPEYLAPGVYVEEVPGGTGRIEGVDTHTAAFLGAAERGPLTPTLVTSQAEYARHFGGRFADGKDFLPDAVASFFHNGGQRLYVCRLVGAAATTATRAFGAFTVSAIGPGAWGRRVWVRIDDGSAAGFRLRAAYWTEGAGSAAPFDPWDATAAGRTPQPAAVEEFDGLRVDPTSPDHYARWLATSQLVRLTVAAGTAADVEPLRGSGMLDQGGTEGPGGLTASDYTGAPTATRSEPQGLAALAAGTDRSVALVYAPHPRHEADEVARRLVAHCEALRSCFAVLDGSPGPVDIATLDPRATLVDSTYAAYYVPWLRVADPAVPGGRRVPPGGAMLGIYAHTDIGRGIHKAPANEIVRGAIALDDSIGASGQRILNPRGVNVIRSLPGRGIRVWGTRTLANDPEWRYVNVRRLMIFLEQSIDRGLRWVVFEPNEQALWSRLQMAVNQFLTGVWRDGALLGSRPEEAFFVRCDRTTMTQADLDAGRLVCEVGVAPLKPAEFVIFRIGWLMAS